MTYSHAEWERGARHLVTVLTHASGGVYVAYVGSDSGGVPVAGSLERMVTDMAGRSVAADNIGVIDAPSMARYPERQIGH